LGGFDPVVAYSASYVVAPQAISREYTLFNGQEPPDPPRDIAPVALANPGFEALDTGNYVYWGQMDDTARQTFGWSAGGNGGNGPALFNNGSGWGYQNVPDGAQGISLQGDAFIRQTIQIPGPGSYILGWQAASRGGQVNPYLAEILDGETVVVASPVYSTGNPAWNRVEWHFDLAAGGTFTLRLRGLNPAGGDNSVALDGFGLGRDLGEGHRTVSSAREIASREVSILVPDSAVPDPVTGLGSGFDATSSVSAFSAIDLSWPNYNEEGQRDVARYRIYVATSFFTDVSSVQPYEVVNAGRLRHTVRGLFGGNIYYVAVVAEDALGNWNPTVRSVSAKASVGALGEARNLVVVSGVDSLRFTWAPPEQVDAFLAHYNLYLGPSPTPIPLPSSAASYQATGLLPAKGYPVRLTTVDTFGTESGGITLVAATLLDNPGGVVGQAFDGMVRLTWIHSEPNELVKTYRVYRSAAPFSSVAGMTPIVATREPRVDIAGLANGATTYFAVTTVNLVDGEKPGVTSIPATPIPVAGNFADLLASQVTGPLSAFGGETISIRWAVTNIGPGVTSTKGGIGVASWVDRIVLSPDTVFGDADDVVLAEVPHAGGLASGAGYTGAADVYVPPTLFGNYSLSVLADALDAVYEHLDAGTNRAVALQPLVVFAPVAPTITQQPQDQAQPEGRQVTFTVGISGSQPLAFQWSHDNVPILDATNRSLVLPRISPDSAGAYRLHIGNVVGETNTRPAILTVLPPPADLVVSGIQAPAGIVAGRPVTVSWTVRNGGQTPAGAPWQETLYLADNPEGLHPTAVLGVTAPDSLGIGATATRSPTVIFPTGFAGRYWLAVRVDGDDQVVEDAGEANNYYVSPQPVTISSTDLVPALVSAPSGALFGDSIPVGWTVTNGGTTNTASGWSDGIYLAVTPGSLAGATLLAGVPAPAAGLVAGASYNATATVKLPLGAQYPPGTYYILVAADAGNAEPESNEANNLAGRPITLGLPARPDLAVTDVGSVDTAFPGQTVPVTWAVTNRGPAVVDASWLETVRLVDAGIVGLSDPVQIQNLLASAPTLSTLRVTNRLAPGEFVRRTHFVSLPIGGASGDVRMAVTVDARDEVFEENEGNNTGYGTNRLHVPIALSLELSSATVAEDAALPVRATITRNGDRSNPLSVTLTLGDTRELSFTRGTRSPASSTVIIPVGQTSVGVDLYPVQDHVVDPDQPVNVAAAAAGYESANATLTVRNVDIPTLTLAAASPSVTEGGTVALTVTRDVVTGSPLTVALGSSNPAQLSPPDLVVIPAGAASVSFAVYAVDDANPEADATYSIGASAPGFNGGVVNVTVRDNDVPSLVVSLSKRAVSEGDGPQATSMTVTRDPVGAGALTIEPFASDPALVTTPLRITIPPGQASRSFPLGVTDDSLVNGTRNVVVGAYA